MDPFAELSTEADSALAQFHQTGQMDQLYAQLDAVVAKADEYAQAARTTLVELQAHAATVLNDQQRAEAISRQPVIDDYATRAPLVRVLELCRDALATHDKVSKVLWLQAATRRLAEAEQLNREGQLN